MSRRSLRTLQLGLLLCSGSAFATPAKHVAALGSRSLAQASKRLEQRLTAAKAPPSVVAQVGAILRDGKAGLKQLGTPHAATLEASDEAHSLVLSAAGRHGDSSRTVRSAISDFGTSVRTVQHVSRQPSRHSLRDLTVMSDGNLTFTRSHEANGAKRERYVFARDLRSIREGTVAPDGTQLPAGSWVVNREIDTGGSQEPRNLKYLVRGGSGERPVRLSDRQYSQLMAAGHR